jgi:hypothetical protein
MSTSWLKIKSPAYSQMVGRCEVFEALSSGARRTVTVRHTPVLRRSAGREEHGEYDQCRAARPAMPHPRRSISPMRTPSSRRP